MQGYLKPQRLDLTLRQANRHFAGFCGLCQALREVYGIPARFLVNHDALFLKLLIEAQQRECPRIQHIRCGIKPIIPHEAIADPLAASFAAAVSILVADSRLRDVSFDGKLYLLRQSADLGRTALKARVQRAEAALVNAGFSPGVIYDLLERQDYVEKIENLPLHKYAEPTAEGVEALVVHTATIACRPENVLELRILGHNLGNLLYLVDAVFDIDKDLMQENFNPMLNPRRPRGSARRLCESTAGESQELLAFWHSKVAQSLQGLKLERHADVLHNIIGVSLRETVASALSMLADLEKVQA